MRASWVWLIYVLGVYPLGVLANEKASPQDPTIEGARIERERQEANAVLSAQEQRCYSSFMVNSCLQDVRQRRNEIMSNLKRQETKLHDAHRMQQGQEQRQHLEEKMQERRMRDAQVAASSGTTPTQRQELQQNKQRQHQEQADSTQSKPSKSKTASGVDLAALEERRSAHAQKIKAAEQRRLERDKRVRETKPVKPLPL